MIAAAALAAVVFAILWPEERGTPAGRARALLFAVMAGVVGFGLAGRQADRAADVSTSRAFQAYTEGLTKARGAVAAEWLLQWGRGGRSAPAPRAPAAGRNPPRPLSARVRPAGRSLDQPAKLRRDSLNAYARAVRLAPKSSLFRRQYAILLADAGRREEALRQFREVTRRGAPDDKRQRLVSDQESASSVEPASWERGQDARPGGDMGAGRPRSQEGPGAEASRVPPAVEASLWERLYGPQPPKPAELPALVARLRQLKLGWFELLVLRSVYRRMGLARQETAASAAAGRQAALLVGALNGMVLAMLAGALLGLGLLTFAVVNWRAGRLRPVPAAFHVGAAPLLETFVLYLFLYVSPVLAQRAGLPLPVAAGRSATGILLLLFLSDLLALIAVAYLWQQLRARGTTLAEIGLHTRELGRNVLYGIGGYLAALPWVLGSAWLATWLGARFFPQVAPPFHPIQAITVAAPFPWARFALLVVAAVGAPVLEELFFRGLLYGGLRRRYGVPVGVLASAAVFSLLHPQLPLGFLPIFVLGVIFAVGYEWRQSLVPGMVMHALNNAFVMVALNLIFPPG